ncbi:MAG: hypothetical protein MK108_11390 [Mariniblastus sp.]|nr:hypothetical protein [Mariniblastus sp.]
MFQNQARPSTRTWAWLPLVAAAMVIGCHDGQGEGSLSQVDPAEPTTRAADEQETTTVAVTPGDVDQSPAATVQLPPRETAPETICQLFVRYLSVGNRSMAEQMLTPAALTTTSRAQLQLEPVGGKNAKYEMQSPRYATNKKKLCQVDCCIKDEMDDQTVETEITWICRLQKDGWRIAGMMVEVTPDQPKDYLSFENVDDVTRIKSSLIDSVSSDIRNAAKDDETTRLK